MMNAMTLWIRWGWMAAIAVVVWVMLGLGAAWAQPDTLPSVEAPSETTGASTAVDEGTVQNSGANRYSRLWNNLWVLSKNTWKDVGWFTGKAIVVALVAGVAGFFAGCVAGLITYLLLRKRRWFDAPWSWYRYVRWMWSLLFIGFFALGFGYAGMNLGAAHVLKKGITDERIVDRAVSQLYCAVAFDTVEYKLAGKEKVEELRKVLEKSEGLASVISADLGKLVREVLDDPRVRENVDPRYRRWLDTISDSKLGQMTFSKLTKDFDPRAVVLLFYAMSGGDETSRAYIESNPQASPLVAACTEMFANIRLQLCGMVNAVVYPNAAASFILGVGLPLGLTGLLRWMVRLTSKPPLV
jgi:hypothetical protein